MTARPLPPHDELRKLLKYDRVTGHLFWRRRPLSMFPAKKHWLTWNARFADKRAFNVKHHAGYLYGCLLGWHYLTHRVIWYLVHNETPEEIDHINGNRSDNRLRNLRSATRGMNCKNLTRSSKNTSGVSGVCWDAGNSKWLARIGHKHLGRFESFKEAVAVRLAAERENDFHKNHGRTSSLK